MMKKQIHKLIETAARVTVVAQTLNAMQQSPTLRAKLVGLTMKKHLDDNNRKAYIALLREYHGTPKNLRHPLKVKWARYITSMRPRIAERTTALGIQDTLKIHDSEAVKA
jgi:hypothetical protein